MAALHIPDIDEQVLTYLRERARREGTSLEEQVRALLKQAAEERDGDGLDDSQTLRMPPADRSFRKIDPVEAPGISASELLIRDRRR